MGIAAFKNPRVQRYLEIVSGVNILPANNKELNLSHQLVQAFHEDFVAVSLSSPVFTHMCLNPAKFNAVIDHHSFTNACPWPAIGH